MRTKETQASDLDPLRDDRLWEPLPIALALGAGFEQRAHELYGPGIRFRVAGAEAPLDLTIYPHTETVQLQTPDTAETFFHQPQPAVLEDMVIFEAFLPTATRTILVSRDGQYSVVRVPHEPPRVDHQQKPEVARRFVHIAGLLQQAPAVQETARSGIIVRFPLVEQLPTGGAVTHQCYSTKHYARQIKQQAFQAGEPVILNGEKQTHAVRGETGELLKKQVIYCYRLRRVNEKTNPAATDSHSTVSSGSRSGGRESYSIR